MEQYVIKGKTKLSGTVVVDGAKNAVLPLIAAAILPNEPVTLTNVPEVSDVINMLNALKDLTGQTAKSLTIGATNLAKLTNAQKGIATDKNWTLS